MSDSSPAVDHVARSARTAELVDRLHAIVVEREAMHPGRSFPLDGHLVGSIGEAAAEATFALRLLPPRPPDTTQSLTTVVPLRSRRRTGTRRSGFGRRPTQRQQRSSCSVSREPRRFRTRSSSTARWNESPPPQARSSRMARRVSPCPAFGNSTPLCLTPSVWPRDCRLLPAGSRQPTATLAAWKMSAGSSCASRQRIRIGRSPVWLT